MRFEGFGIRLQDKSRGASRSIERHNLAGALERIEAVAALRQHR
jgi:hypothetical protein